MSLLFNYFLNFFENSFKILNNKDKTFASKYAILKCFKINILISLFVNKTLEMFCPFTKVNVKLHNFW